VKKKRENNIPSLGNEGDTKEKTGKWEKSNIRMIGILYQILNDPNLNPKYH
jgi:hypothetical protein